MVVDICNIVIFWLGHVCVDVVALVLVSVVWGPGPRQVHRYLDVVICGSWRVGGVVLRSLLLLLLLLGSSRLGLWSELILVLSECVVEPPWVGNASPGSDELDHLLPFCYVDRSGFIIVVSLWDWEFDDFIQYAWG